MNDNNDNGTNNTEYKITLKKCLLHMKAIIKHKLYVFQYCCKVGIPLQGLAHDLSKFSPVEFFESVKYYNKNDSPINTCKKINGVSMAWLHHKSSNKHHYEYWQDNFDSGTTHLLMPFKYALEMLCDYLGASKNYMGKNFTYDKEYEWWINKQVQANALHPQIKEFISLSLGYVCIVGEKAFFDKNTLYYFYTCALDDSQKDVPRLNKYIYAYHCYCNGYKPSI